MNFESNISKLIQLALSKAGATIFRNNTGKAWQGQYFRTKDGDVLLKNPRIIEFGLHKGSSDIIGWKEVVITPEMVGTRVAIFTAVEVKNANGRVSAEQLTFINRVREAGGIAGIAKTPQEATNLIEKMK